MSKLLLLTDTHFGIRGASEILHGNNRLFFKNVLFPYLKNNINQIDAVIHLGDVFDDRRKIDTMTANLARHYFFEPMAEILGNAGKTMHIVCGNHDIYLKNSLRVNSLREFVTSQNYGDSSWNPFVIHIEPIVIEQLDAMLIPWITDTNRESILQAVENNRSARYAFAHLELKGFMRSKVQAAPHGDDPQHFSKFKQVFSGHYHYKHQGGNVTYLGSSAEHNWGEAADPHGFHVLDTETGQLEFFANPYNNFEYIEVGGVLTSTADHRRFYRLYRNQNDKQSTVDDFIKVLYAHGAVTIDVINRSLQAQQQISEQATTIEAIEDTPMFIRNFVEDKDVAEILVDLYNRAILEQA